MILPVDIIVISNNVFNQLIIENSFKKMFVRNKSGQTPETLIKENILSPTRKSLKNSDFYKNSQKSKKRSQKNKIFNMIKNDKECYTIHFSCLKIKRIFRYSVYHIIELKYKKFNLLKKNNETTLFLISLDIENFKNALDVLISGKIKMNPETKEQLKMLHLIKTKDANKNYWSEHIARKVKPSELIVPKSKPFETFETNLVEVSNNYMKVLNFFKCKNETTIHTKSPKNCKFLKLSRDELYELNSSLYFVITEKSLFLPSIKMKLVSVLYSKLYKTFNMDFHNQILQSEKSDNLNLLMASVSFKSFKISNIRYTNEEKKLSSVSSKENKKKDKLGTMFKLFEENKNQIKMKDNEKEKSYPLYPKSNITSLQNSVSIISKKRDSGKKKANQVSTETSSVTEMESNLNNSIQFSETDNLENKFKVGKLETLNSKNDRFYRFKMNIINYITLKFQNTYNLKFLGDLFDDMKNEIDQSFGESVYFKILSKNKFYM